MEFLLGNPFSTPVGQCLGKAPTAAPRGLGEAPRVPARQGPAPTPPRDSAGRGRAALGGAGGRRALEDTVGGNLPHLGKGGGLLAGRPRGLAADPL